MATLEGRVLGGCKLIRKIGAGGSGEVYLGEQQRVGNRPVAVKIVQPDGTMTPEQIETLERRFEREAALLGQFSHPNILPVHDSGVEDGLLYLVMQYAPAGSLSDAMRGRSEQTLTLPASLAFTTDIISQVAAALQYTHERGIVHRDVKPGNVLIRVEPNGHWHALLADYGVARAQETTSQKTQVTGTFAYMAPEQFTGQFSPASDQYALGVMTFQLLTGHTPFEGDLAMVTHGHMYDAPPSVRQYVGQLPPAVDAVVQRALAKDPAKRYPSVAAYADALRAAAATVAPSDAEPVGAVVPNPGSAAGAAPAAANAPQGDGKPPAWPMQKPPRDTAGLTRTAIAVLAAALLLIALVGGVGLINAHNAHNGTSAQAATQTAQAATTQANAAATYANATAAARASATAAQAASATQTASAAVPTVPTASATAGVGSDVTTPSPAPANAGALLWSDPQPVCEKSGGQNWVTDNATTVPCDQTSGNPIVTAQSGSQLACIEQQTTKVADGYFSVIASPRSGRVVLGVRQGAGTTSGTTTSTVGYLVQVNPTEGDTGTYAIYAVNGSATPTPPLAGGSGNLPTKLAQDFDMGVLVSGNTIALYINGQQIASVQDSTYTSGWVSLCSTGATMYHDAQVYQHN